MSNNTLNYKSCVSAIFWIFIAVAIVGTLAAVLLVQDASAAPLLDGEYTAEQVAPDVAPAATGKTSYPPELPPKIPPHKLPPSRPAEYTPLTFDCGDSGEYVCESRGGR